MRATLSVVVKTRNQNTVILKVLGSSSSGNCYILETDNTALILECGVAFKEVKRALNFKLNKVCGALVTHEHLDHCAFVRHFTAAGIDVFGSKGTLDAFDYQSHRLHYMLPNVKHQVGEFTIMPFDVKHDCKQPFGYLIQHADCGTVLFLTDSYYSPVKFKGLNNILVEANYSSAILAQRSFDNELNSYVKDRVIKSHMSLETCMELLGANDLSKVNNIVLIHLSDLNSDAAFFKKQIEEQTGKAVHIAQKSLTIPFNKQPF